MGGWLGGEWVLDGMGVVLWVLISYGGCFRVG